MYNAKEIKDRTNQLFESRGEKAARVQIPQSAYKSPCLRDFLTFARAFLSPAIS